MNALNANLQYDGAALLRPNDWFLGNVYRDDVVGGLLAGSAAFQIASSYSEGPADPTGVLMNVFDHDVAAGVRYVAQFSGDNTGLLAEGVVDTIFVGLFASSDNAMNSAVYNQLSALDPRAFVPGLGGGDGDVWQYFYAI